MSDRPASTPPFEVPADLPRDPGPREKHRTETYLAAVAAAKAAPSRETYRAAAIAAMDLHTAYEFIGTSDYGVIVRHQLAHVGQELLRQAVAYSQAATNVEPA